MWIQNEDQHHHYRQSNQVITQDEEDEDEPSDQIRIIPLPILARSQGPRRFQHDQTRQVIPSMDDEWDKDDLKNPIKPFVHSPNKEDPNGDQTNGTRETYSLKSTTYPPPTIPHLTFPSPLKPNRPTSQPPTPLPPNSHNATGRPTRHERSNSEPLNLILQSMDKIGHVLFRHLKFVGPGLVSSVAYFDPGNWTVDLQAGSMFGYKLLFVILLAGLGAALLQVLSLRLGTTTSLSLPAQIRALFLRIRDHPKISPYRWRRNMIMGGLYTLYVLAEVAIVATDLAELLGSAIALNLIFPKLPLWAGVLLTAVDVLIVLAFFQRPEKGRKGMMAFELLIVCLVLCVFICFVILLIQIKPVWGDVFKGYLPSSTIVQPDALYVAVGIIGATVMPHGLFLGSHLATVDRLDTAPVPPPERGEDDGVISLIRRARMNALPRKDWTVILPARWRKRSEHVDASSLTFPSDEEVEEVEPTKEEKEADAKWEREQARYEAEVRTFDRVEFVSVSIAHSTVDTTLSLLGFAVTINSAILILASAAFYYGGDAAIRAAGANADLFGAHQLITQQISKAAAFVFALALLCSGQSASVTATLAGVVVSEGFIEWKTSPIVRRIITRAISIIPSVVVAVAVGRSGVNQLLVASQVCLSVVLPFVIFPLVWICSDKKVMTVTNSPTDASESTIGVQRATQLGLGSNEQTDPEASPIIGDGIPTREADRIRPDDESVTRPEAEVAQALDAVAPKSKSFTSHWIVTVLGYALFAVVTIANCYVLLMLMMGK